MPARLGAQNAEAIFGIVGDLLSLDEARLQDLHWSIFSGCDL